MGYRLDMYECPACGERFEELAWNGEDVFHCGLACSKVPANPTEGSKWGRLVGGIDGYDMTMDSKPVRVRNRAHRRAEAAARGLVVDESAGL